MFACIGGLNGVQDEFDECECCFFAFWRVDELPLGFFVGSFVIGVGVEGHVENDRFGFGG